VYEPLSVPFVEGVRADDGRRDEQLLALRLDVGADRLAVLRDRVDARPLGAVDAERGEEDQREQRKPRTEEPRTCERAGSGPV
jgi:hypothetical protein